MQSEAAREAKFEADLEPDQVAQMKSVKKIANIMRNTIDRLSEPMFNTPVKRGKGKKKNKGKKVAVSSE